MSKKPSIFATCKAGCLWETVHKDDVDIASRILTADGSTLELFVGTEEQYNKLPKEQQENTLALFTDDNSAEKLSGTLIIEKNLQDFALNLPVGVHNYRFNGYTGDDIPYYEFHGSNVYSHSCVTIYKPSLYLITIVLWGNATSPIQYMRYTEYFWNGWQKVQVEPTNNWIEADVTYSNAECFNENLEFLELGKTYLFKLRYGVGLYTCVLTMPDSYTESGAVKSSTTLSGSAHLYVSLDLHIDGTVDSLWVYELVGENERTVSYREIDVSYKEFL